MRTVMTIAGSDSLAGAGVQADLKTFAAFGVYGVCAIAAVTAQTTRKVKAVEPVSLDLLEAQIDAAVEARQPEVWKLGMLFDEDRVALVARKLEEHRPPAVVLDPVLVSSSGRRLLSEAAVEVMKAALFPLVTLVTPNLPEAFALTGAARDCSRETLCAKLLALGPSAVLLKGGHGDEPALVRDLLVTGSKSRWLEQPRRQGASPHGTGCTLASAIAAMLARGASLENAAEESQRYLGLQIREAQRNAREGEIPLLPHSPFVV